MYVMFVLVDQCFKVDFFDVQGRDVVGMARTGSGKTGAFVIPLLQKLAGKRGVGSASGGVRALILTPTRELAIQTSKFVRELGKFCDLKTVCVLGGDAMEKQFAQMHSNPGAIKTSCISTLLIRNVLFSTVPSNGV